MRYGSVCSGIEAATVAWHSLGWVPSFFSEIEKFPREVLAHHYPDVPLHGDFTTIGADQYGSIDLLVGGTPCQSFSIAGLRKGLDDDRGNLALEFIKLAQRTRPRWVVWENVPGVLSSNGGRDFGTFLGALGEIGYGFAYRVLDAQYFGVAQRRRRVFVVGYLGDWRRAAAVLFERESLSGNPAPSRESREEITGTVTTRSGNGGGGGLGTDEACSGFVQPVANCLETTCNDYSRADGFNMMAFQSNANACDAMAAGKNISPTMRSGDSPAIAYGLPGNWIGRKPENGGNQVEPFYEHSPCQTRTDRHAVAYPLNTMTIQGRPSDNGRMGLGIGSETDPSPTLTKAHSDAVAYNAPEIVGTLTRASSAGGTITHQDASSNHLVTNHMAVRRLTPTECERLQGFPDGYTNIKEKCPDGPRYKALGNSMAVPVMHWIGKRIQMVEELCQNEN